MHHSISPHGLEKKEKTKREAVGAGNDCPVQKQNTIIQQKSGHEKQEVMASAGMWFGSLPSSKLYTLI